MVSVQHVTESLLKERPFVHEALRRGIINHAALAEELTPDIERAIGGKVTFSAVNMAIRRLSERLAERKAERILFDNDSDLSIRSHLVEITLYKTDDIQAHVRRIYDAVDLKHGDFITVTQGLYEVMVITNEKHARKALDRIPKRAVKHVIRELSGITVHISPKATQASGLFYLVTRALAWEDINIIDIVSTYTELTFIIKETQTGRAFDILKALIERS